MSYKNYILYRKTKQLTVYRVTTLFSFKLPNILEFINPVK